MKIQVGDVFRVAHESARDPITETIAEQYPDFKAVTSGSHGIPADLNKGIFAFKALKAVGDARVRRPAIILLSNPLKAGQEGTPWLDIIDEDAGYALYNGDNRSSMSKPEDARGNRLLLDCLELYSDRQLRQFAPPILLFKQIAVGGRTKGYRAFCGYGVPTSVRLRTQHDPVTHRYFSNIVFELCLLDLKHENERLDWCWIDDRRDKTLSASQSARKAPRAWRDWIIGAEPQSVRRNVARQLVVSRARQLEECDARNIKILDRVIEHYRLHRHYPFEGLASAIACRVLGSQCFRGWVTRRSGDGGVDFVNRMDLGVPPFVRSFVVLGQAKCFARTGSVNGEDLARLASRLRRGWIGVFVTTGMFSAAAQAELEQDKYPLVLVNGNLVASQLRQMMDERNMSLEEILETEHKWYSANAGPLDADRILDLEGPLPKLGDNALQDQTSSLSEKSDL